MDLESIQNQELHEWIGREEQHTDHIGPVPIAALSATLDRDDPPPRPGDPLPPLWHWLYFLPVHRQSELAPDGHAARGGFLPPVPLPRRMWAGSRFWFHHPLRVGQTISRRSKIVSITYKQGRSGPLVFVLVRHEIRNEEGLALTEEHDIVYRGNSSQSAEATPKAAPIARNWERSILPDDVLLFRYSALTFNGHRIHYDRRYATETEGYPGLVVHGPLIATLLLDLFRRAEPEADLSQFAFRAVSPLFHKEPGPEPFRVCGAMEAPRDAGREVRLWAENAAGGLAMEASAILR